ncbi:baseplate J/gp47 family protein, partial [Leptospira brenneri]|uniref:baseplate J/gp47 family protein n=1 Tax=Leptospira brenneri TaxID=2023182 RepID=UPI000CC19D65
GNVTPNAITEHIDYIPEIDVVYNPDTIPYFGGRDRERLATVRERLRQIQIGATSQEWTADWYVLIALSFTYVEKVVFKSSKSLGIPGVVKLLLLGPDGSALSPAQLTEVSEHFNSEALNPGGAAHVIAENAGAIPINKIFSLYFASADSIPTPAALQTLVDTFFAELKDQQSFIVNSFKSLLLQFPDAVS